MNKKDKKFARSYMRRSIGNYVDPLTGELDKKQLVYSTATAMGLPNLYLDEESELWDIVEYAEEEHFCEED